MAKRARRAGKSSRRGKATRGKATARRTTKRSNKRTGKRRPRATSKSSSETKKNKETKFYYLESSKTVQA